LYCFGFGKRNNKKLYKCFIVNETIESSKTVEFSSTMKPLNFLDIFDVYLTPQKTLS
jgi:hypothetical protein